MAAEQQPDSTKAGIMTQEQDALIDLYLSHLDIYFENLKTSEKIQVEIETLHLKRILSE